MADPMTDPLDEILPTPDEVDRIRDSLIRESVKQCLITIATELRNGYLTEPDIRVNLTAILNANPRIAEKVMGEVGGRCRKRGWELYRNPSNPSIFTVGKLEQA